MCVGVHNYMNEQIQHVGSNVSKAILAKLRSRCEQFRIEVGAQLDSLRGVQGVIVGGVGNLTQAVENKLTENEERIGEQVRVLETLRSNVGIIQEIGLSREATMKTNKELFATNQKLTGLARNMKSAVIKSADALIQTYTGMETRKEGNYG